MSSKSDESPVGADKRDSPPTPTRPASWHPLRLDTESPLNKVPFGRLRVPFGALGELADLESEQERLAQLARLLADEAHHRRTRGLDARPAQPPSVADNRSLTWAEAARRLQYTSADSLRRQSKRDAENGSGEYGDLWKTAVVSPAGRRSPRLRTVDALAAKYFRSDDVQLESE